MNYKHLLLSFDGRIGRAPYWYFTLAVLVVAFVIMAVTGFSAFGGASMQAGAPPPSPGAAGLLIPLFSLLILWPALAVQVKRWHDVDKSGWWVLIAFIPLVGSLIALVFNGFVAGTPGPNRFGNPPA